MSWARIYQMPTENTFSFFVVFGGFCLFWFAGGGGGSAVRAFTDKPKNYNVAMVSWSTSVSNLLPS